MIKKYIWEIRTEREREMIEKVIFISVGKSCSFSEIIIKIMKIKKNKRERE